MSYSFMYPDVIKRIKSVCLSCIQGNKNIDDLHNAIRYGELIIVSYEEKDIRNFLTDMEGELELVKFTYDKQQQAEIARDLAQKVLNFISSYEMTSR